MSYIFGFFGSILVGLSQQYGLGAAWGGVMVFKSNQWRLCNALGWVMLGLSFPLNYFYN